MSVEFGCYSVGIKKFTKLANNKKRTVSVRVSNMLQMYYGDKFFLILNRGDFKKGLLRAGLVGGGARIFDRGGLKGMGVTRIDNHHSGIPERFEIPTGNLNSIVPLISSEVMRAAIELDIRRELQEELTEEVFEGRRGSPILQPFDINELLIIFERKLLSKVTTNPDTSIDVKIIRLFRTQISERIREKMEAADSVIFTPSSREFDIGVMQRGDEGIKIANIARAAHQQQQIVTYQ